MENDNSFMLSLPVGVSKGTACRSKWGIGNNLFVFPCKEKNQESDLNRSHSLIGSVNIQHVKWDCDMQSPHLRQLVNECHGVFQRIQQESDVNNTSNHIPKMLKHSREYRSVMKACSMEINSALKNADSADEESLASQLQMLETMELVWSLSELLLLQTCTGGEVLHKLLEWARIHFVEADRLASAVLRSDSRYECEEYWPAVLSYVLQGRTAEAQRLLSIHPDRATHPFMMIEQLLSRLPLYEDYAGKSLVEFEMAWQSWQEECIERQRDGSFLSHPQLNTVCQILCGDDDAFLGERELIGSWYCMLLYRLLYQNPAVKPYDLQYHTQFCIDAYGGALRMQPYDHIILAILEYDTHQVIKESSTTYGSWWFASHLTDLLFHCRKLESQTLNFGANLREFLLLEFATSLFSHDSLWQMGVVYLDHCPEYGRYYLEELVERLPLESERKVHKVLHICERREMLHQVRSICKAQGMQAMKRGRLGSALLWAVRSKDVTFASAIAEKFLAQYNKSGTFSDLDLLDNLGPSMLLSPKLTFLGKYREMHRLYEEKDFRAAASLLLSLLKARIAPPCFMLTLLMDALPLLEAEEVIYSSEETYELLHCLSEITTDKEIYAKKQKLEKAKVQLPFEGEDIKLDLIRLALARNLSRALIYEGSL